MARDKVTRSTRIQSNPRGQDGRPAVNSGELEDAIADVAGDLATHIADTTNPHNVTADQVGVDALFVQGLGYWAPVTNGDPVTPEILFDGDGNVIVAFTATP